MEMSAYGIIRAFIFTDFQLWWALPKSSFSSCLLLSPKLLIEEEYYMGPMQENLHNSSIVILQTNAQRRLTICASNWAFAKILTPSRIDQRYTIS